MMTSFHHFIPEVFSCFFRFPIFTETTFKCSASTYLSSVDINNTWEWCWVCLLSRAELISEMRQIESLLFFHFHVFSIFTSYSWWFQIVKFKISFWLISVVIMKLISNFIRGCCCRCKNGCCRREKKGKWRKHNTFVTYRKSVTNQKFYIPFGVNHLWSEIMIIKISEKFAPSFFNNIRKC